MSINVNTPKTTGPIQTTPSAPGATSDSSDLSGLVKSLSIGDQVHFQVDPNTLPSIFTQLTPRDQQALLELPPAVAQTVLSDNVPSNVDAAKYQIAQNLLELSKSLVPGGSLTFNPPQAWGVADAAIAYKVVNNMSYSDRQRIAGTTLDRKTTTLINDGGGQSHAADGKADLTMEQGHGFLGRTGCYFANLFEKWSLTAPLGLMLRDWFPHALENYHSRTIEIGDAQASRMEQVLTHEFGHQVEFGPAAEPDLQLMSEWAKLSGWQDAKGNPAIGVEVGASGDQSGLAASVRPTKTDNFVYQDFTKEITPQEVQATAAQIPDPQLRAEFLQTAKIKKNLQAAIKETVGADVKGYSMASPLEDFAESYRAFYMDPATLAKSAPDKFLFLNSISKKYTPAQVQQYFKAAGQDPQAVATKLATTGLMQSTLDNIYKANGLTANAQALGQAAAQSLNTDSKLPAITQAFLTLQQKVSAGDLSFVSSFTKDPSKALGDLWGKLSTAEKAQFSTENQRVALVQGMQTGKISGAAMASQTVSDTSKAAMQDFAQRLITDGGLRSQLSGNPDAVLDDSAFQSFPPALQKQFQDPAFRKNFAQFVGSLNGQLSGASKLPFIGADLVNHVGSQISNWDNATLSGAMTLVGKNPDTAAKVFTGQVSAVQELGPGGGG
ncbi:MAG TPA: hypothetical protein V6D47_11185 [Oscillatoriaceae cyanobacterium]